MICNTCGTQMTCAILEWYCPSEDNHSELTSSSEVRILEVERNGDYTNFVFNDLDNLIRIIEIPGLPGSGKYHIHSNIEGVPFDAFHSLSACEAVDKINKTIVENGLSSVTYELPDEYRESTDSK